MSFKSTLMAFLICTALLVEQSKASCLLFNGNLPFEVYRNGAAPRTDSHAGFRWFPGTVHYSGFGTADQLEHAAGSADRHLFLWVNRCQFAPRGSVCGYNQVVNPPTIRSGSNSYAFYFTSLNRADACTRAQLYYAFEAENFAVNVLGRYGVTAILPDQDPLAFVNYSGGFRDVCYLWAHDLLDDVQGVTFDFEPQDDRPPSRTTLLSDYFSRFLRDPRRAPRRDMYLYTNPIDDERAPTNGIVRNSNTRTLLDLYDQVSILSYDEWHPYLIASDIAQQIAYWGATTAADRAKIFQIVGIGTLSEIQITIRRAAVFQHGLAGVSIWNNLPGTTLTCNSTEYHNRVSCLVYGTCSGF